MKMSRRLRRAAGSILTAIDRRNRIRNFRVWLVTQRLNRWLREAHNVVHVGANTGQEAPEYARRGLGVLWIEPIPIVFEKLRAAIAPYPNQRAYMALAADIGGKAFNLHVASNNGESSSIFDLAEHRDIWPEVTFEQSIEVRSETLDEILAKNPGEYDALVIDTQGSELLVLKGASGALDSFRFVNAEAADFNAYQGCTTAAEIESFLRERGFELMRKERLAEKPDGTGAYYDLLFRRRD